MIYQIHTGEVINVETLEDIRGWLTDDIYEIATDLLLRPQQSQQRMKRGGTNC